MSVGAAVECGGISINGEATRVKGRLMRGLPMSGRAVPIS